MSIDEQPMNVYWSGQRTETSNKFKVNDKGSVTNYSDLPSTGNQKGDMYNVTSLNGENYIWNGSEWDRFGTSDINVVHKSGDETISGTKTFSDPPVVSGLYPSFSLKHTGYTKGETTTSSPGWSTYLWHDASNNILGQIAFVYAGNSSKDSSIRIFVPDMHSSDATGREGVSLYCLSASYEFSPTVNTLKLGSSTRSWAQLYAVTGTIGTSDKRLKDNIIKIPDTVLDAWTNVEWKLYQFKDAIVTKGNNARFHAGIVAQDVATVFTNAGLDISRYGLYCYDAWNAEPEIRDSITGEILQNAVKAGDKYAVRYIEVLCIEAAYQRRRADRLEARIKALEEKLK